jgi:hypothetical protein
MEAHLEGSAGGTPIELRNRLALRVVANRVAIGFRGDHTEGSAACRYHPEALHQEPIEKAAPGEIHQGKPLFGVSMHNVVQGHAHLRKEGS